MPIFLSFNDTTDQPVAVSDEFLRSSEFFQNMLNDCEIADNQNSERTIIPFPFEISSEKNFLRFYEFWQTNKFQDRDNIIVDIVEFINLADYLQMNQFKQELFYHLKNKLGKQSMDNLNILLNPFGTDVKLGEQKYENMQKKVQVLKNFYDNEKSLLTLDLSDVE